MTELHQIPNTLKCTNPPQPVYQILLFIFHAGGFGNMSISSREYDGSARMVGILISILQPLSPPHSS